MQKTDGEKRVEQDKRLKDNLSKIKNKLIIISGKGGVGKTTTAVNLAYGLASKGKSVGILDIDIHGPNIAKMLGIEGKKLEKSDLGIEPVLVTPELKAISMSFLLDNPDQPVIWRGPLKMTVIKQFLSDVNWGELDYLVIDSPPGTGDEPLSICQLIPDLSGAVVVTTPQDIAVLDARKSVFFARELKIPIVGIIENMSGFTCPRCQEKIYLFGVGGGKKAALDLGIPFLGEMPIEAEMVKLGDEGKPFIDSMKESKTAAVMNEIIENITFYLKKNDSGKNL